MLKLIPKSIGVDACCGGKGLGKIGEIGERGESRAQGDVRAKEATNGDDPGYVGEDDGGVGVIEMIW